MSVDATTSNVSSHKRGGSKSNGKKSRKGQKKLGGSSDELDQISADALEQFNEKQRRRGIIYFSRIPPFMKPAKLRHLMEQYGAVGKIFLKPEDKLVAKKRKKFGGNKKQNYTEGWVEFEDKRIARQVAESLNGTIIGGKKGSFYHDDMWTMLYLPKFKWHHLTERMAYEAAVRQKRLQAEDAQVRRETHLYVEQVEKAKRSAAAEKSGRKRAADDATKEKFAHRIKMRKPLSEE
eukprot:m.334659 g.334659  ORF g.334659 m.334659 type:complete len:235 (-) comp20510_c0_seq2:297-1001(-)